MLTIYVKIYETKNGYLSEFVINFVSENILFKSSPWDQPIKVPGDPWMGQCLLQFIPTRWFEATQLLN